MMTQFIRFMIQTLQFSSSSEGKNVKRSIHGMGQMVSTMVLSRKPSLFGGAGVRGPALGVGLVLDGQKGSKDSINNLDLTVMDTKLRILEILQVRTVTGLVTGMSSSELLEILRKIFLAKIDVVDSGTSKESKERYVFSLAHIVLEIQ